MASKKEVPLGSIPLFSELTAKELGQIRSLMTSVTVGVGTTLTREGQTGHDMFIIVSGNATVSRGGQLLATVGPGDFQGEISLLDGGPRTATVTATTEMELLVATSQEFNAMLDKSPALARRMLPALARRIRALSLAPTH